MTPDEPTPNSVLAVIEDCNLSFNAGNAVRLIALGQGDVERLREARRVLDREIARLGGEAAPMADGPLQGLLPFQVVPAGRPGYMDCPNPECKKQVKRKKDGKPYPHNMDTGVACDAAPRANNLANNLVVAATKV